jgi:hypothetical protein
MLESRPIASLLGFSKSEAIFGLNRAVGPDCYGQDKVTRCDDFVEFSFASYELLQVFDHHLSDFDLGFSLGRVGYRKTIFVAPSRDYAVANRFLENGEC